MAIKRLVKKVNVDLTSTTPITLYTVPLDTKVLLREVYVICTNATGVTRGAQMVIVGENLTSPHIGLETDIAEVNIYAIGTADRNTQLRVLPAGSKVKLQVPDGSQGTATTLKATVLLYGTTLP